jgi:phosphopantothenate synthetase
MKIVLTPVLCALTFALWGCETFTPPSRELTVKDDQTYVLDTNSNRRASYVHKGAKDGKWYLIAEPPPDTALTSTVNAAVSLALKTPAGVDANGSASLAVTQSIVNLAERTQAVIILRDSLYRLSEAYSNGILEPGEYKAEFDSVIAKVTTLAEAQKATAEAQKATAESDTAKAKAKSDTANALMQMMSKPGLTDEDKEKFRSLIPK